VKRASGQHFAQRRKLQYLRKAGGLFFLPSEAICSWGIAEERLKMQLYDSAYNWVIFLVLNAVSTVLFSIL
jgi:hypothetical protein